MSSLPNPEFLARHRACHGECRHRQRRPFRCRHRARARSGWRRRELRDNNTRPDGSRRGQCHPRGMQNSGHFYARRLRSLHKLRTLSHVSRRRVLGTPRLDLFRLLRRRCRPSRLRRRLSLCRTPQRRARAQIAFHATARRRSVGQLCRMDSVNEQNRILNASDALKPESARPPTSNQGPHSRDRRDGFQPNHANHSRTLNKPIAHPTLDALTSKTHKLRWELALNAPCSPLFHHPGLERPAGH